MRPNQFLLGALLAVCELTKELRGGGQTDVELKKFSDIENRMRRVDVIVGGDLKTSPVD